MLDTKGQPIIQPLLDTLADTFIKWKLTANGVTGIAVSIGIAASVWIYIDMVWLGIAFLWLSGLLDAVDGTMARKTKPSAVGTVLDVTFDRVVEGGIILVLAIKYPEHSVVLLLLMFSILIAMTLFLTIGNVARNSGRKSFHYATGLAERTEGFILLTVMVIFAPTWLFWTTLLFIVIEVLSTILRFTAFVKEERELHERT
ncbi:CDP-alcohol phosphatidyltransferase family protein [Paenisporosarcina antarctica]|uniref:CDP-alcohol phosphatidyltransferase family protein n=1 Tax=Paenisporosarcina antarctica TaxID=417367 RepID=A0A4P7A0I0_9BACL|nr:CDP-alcohol phosphatidyltransferase family protein [Paenisporosarcina antarctica]QBP42287.1 CDP-alcohol phosphatidyltransferase family protein [Paenisporosarcina antarctica]